MNYTEQYHWQLGIPEDDKLVKLQRTEKRNYLLYKGPNSGIASEPAYVLKSLDNTKEYPATERQLIGQYKDAATGNEITPQFLAGLKDVSEVKSETKLHSYYRAAFLDKMELSLLAECVSIDTIKDELVSDEMHIRLKSNHVSSSEVKKDAEPFDFYHMTQFEKLMGYPFKDEIRFYLMELGSVSYKNVNLYGVSMKKGSNSEMIQKTMELHKNYPQTKMYIALERPQKGIRCLIDKNGMTFYFSEKNKTITPLNKTISEYIMSRIRETAQKQIQPAKLSR